MFPLDELCFPFISVNCDFFFQGQLIFSNNVHDLCVCYVKNSTRELKTPHTEHTIHINIDNKLFLSDIY